ncbi:MAG: hypothetical protein ACKOAY_01890 [Haliscomenobacter sp.]
MSKNLRQFFAAQQQGLDEKSVEFLIKAIEANNLQGFDYIEFKQSLSALSQMVQLDESTRFRSAFASATAFGLDKPKLLASADHYKRILNNEREKFNTALQNQVQQRIHAQQKEVDLMRRQIEEFQSKIKELETKIQQTQANISQKDDIIKQEMAKIESKKDGFESTIQALLHEIDSDINDIQAYL